MSNDEPKPADVPTIYANSLQLGLSFADFKLFFGEALAPPAPSNLQVGQPLMVPAEKQVNHICVILSPDIIPQLIAGLTKGVEVYQAQFGPLRKPPQKQPAPPEQSQQSDTKQ
jgi:hypothetical protein